MTKTRPPQLWQARLDSEKLCGQSARPCLYFSSASATAAAEATLAEASARARRLGTSQPDGMVRIAPVGPEMCPECASRAFGTPIKARA